MVLYSFSYGLCENVFGHVLSIHSGLGCVFSAVLVYLAICWRKEGFSFSFTYKTACPLMIASLIPFGALMPFGGEVSAFFALAGYTLVLIAVMVIMSNLCYQHGFNALWLFGIERAARLLSVQAGIEIKSFWSSTTGASFFEMLLVGLAVAVMIALATYFFLAEAFALTAREEEVLVLLMQGKKPQQIERELYVANSTVKTHIKHLYRKLDVHSRQELMDLMGIEGPRES